MEMAMDWEQRNLINEINQGKSLAEQLKNHVNCLSSPQSPEILVEKLLSSYEKALSMLNWNGCPVPESPDLLIHSPAGGVSDEDSKDRTQQNVSKKRKSQKKCSEQVKKVCSGNYVLEGPMDDGFSWRKYGQKDILGSNFPRAYYRCSHRHSQGCLAVKQVQRSDEDPSVFEVTYRGRHTCLPPHQAQTSKFHLTKSENQNSGEGLFAQTDKEFQRFPSFSFMEDQIIQGDLRVSPATSDCNYFSTTSSCPDGNFSVQTPESGLTDEISSFLTPTANSSVGDFDFCNFDFNANFTFEDLEFHL